MKMHPVKLYWMEDDEHNDHIKIRAKFRDLNEKYSNHPMMKNFARDKAISMVFASNKLENTLPAGVKHSDTYKLLKNMRLEPQDKVVSWDSDGNSGYIASQLMQHFRAYTYLMSCDQLTVKNLLETHRILMCGAVSDTRGTPILNGKIRTFGVNNGFEDYMSQEIVEEELHDLMDWYMASKENNTNLSEGNDPIYVACKLFYRFLKIHPFEDGNGRIARLLVAYHLSVSGVPFPVCITSGKKRSRKHYYDAIKREDYISLRRSDLYTLISYSVYLGWKNFLNLEKVFSAGIM